MEHRTSHDNLELQQMHAPLKKAMNPLSTQAVMAILLLTQCILVEFVQMK